MKFSSTTFIAGISLAAFAACGDNNDTPPPIENLGSQLDRMGRPAINTAVVSTFAADGPRGEAEDAYNATNNDNSPAEFAAVIAQQLAIYDALVDEGSDGNACGDNPVTNRAAPGGDATLATGATRYGLVATVLADDQIYVNSAAGGVCNQYLAAEITVLGTDLSADCGGRTPSMDIIATSYSVLAAGVPGGVDDGVTAPNGPVSDTFPFLGAPQ